MKPFARIVTAALLLCLTTSIAFAHKVRVFAYAEGNDIVGETAFSGGKAARNVAIEIYNHQNDALIAQTQTDAQGEFSFPIPEVAREQRLDLRIVVNGGDGHKNSWLLNADDYLPPTGTEKAPPVIPAAGSSAVAAQIMPAQPQTFTPQGIDQDTLRRIVDESVERQLRPVKHMLAASKEKQISLQDIIGGLGYIFGLAGIAAYFSSRRKTEKGEQQ